MRSCKGSVRERSSATSVRSLAAMPRIATSAPPQLTRARTARARREKRAGTARPFHPNSLESVTIATRQGTRKLIAASALPTRRTAMAEPRRRSRRAASRRLRLGQTSWTMDKSSFAWRLDEAPTIRTRTRSLRWIPRAIATARRLPSAMAVSARTTLVRPCATRRRTSSSSMAWRLSHGRREE